MNPLSSEDAMRGREAVRRIVSQIERVIVGNHETIEMVVISLLARGHVLIEDIPGVGKTTLAKALAKAVGGTFKRIQFTPDLLPGDVTGLSIYNQKSAEFSFTPGPVFANIVLADEINRATPKTQSALLESMEEAQATVDGITHALPQPFLVIATQNPIEYRGTYPLPEAQMDRFLMRLRMGYPDTAGEVEMLARQFAAGQQAQQAAAEGQHGPDQANVNQGGALLERIEPILSIDIVRQLQHEAARVHVSSSAQQYIVAIAAATRAHVHIALGASPRASFALQRAAQATALVAGREFVTPADIKRLAAAVLPHRLILQEAGGGAGPDSILHRLLDEVPAPAMT